MKNIFILLWKNILIRKNHYFATASEIIVPISFIILSNILPKYPPEIDNDLLFFNEFMSDNCISRHGHYENVIYEPFTPFIQDLMKKVACYAGYKYSSVKPGSLVNMSHLFSIGVNFDISENSSKIPEKLNYTIYPTNEAWINLNNLWRRSDVSVPKYSIILLRNVIEIQRAIDVSYLSYKNISTLQVNFENTDLFDKSPRIFSLAIFFSLLLAFSLMVPPIVGRIVEEKSTGSKELILMMGVKKWELWLSKFIDSFFFLFITVSGMVIFLYIPLKNDSNILNIPFYVVWSLLMYGLISIIIFFFFISCFFEKAGLAVYISEAIWVFTFLLSSYINNMTNAPSALKYVTNFFPHVTLMNAVSTLLAFDAYEKKVNFTEDLSDIEPYLTLIEIVFLMSFNIILYLILTWYVEEIKPGKFGVPKPYGFFCMKSYWLKEKTVLLSPEEGCRNNIYPSCYEPVPENLRKGISVQKVTKIFKSSDDKPLVAVNDVSIDFYHGEISALLGHNGAGKTTMFSIITGLMNPTSGSVSINGYNLALNIEEARLNLGLCPQKDMLFHDLTVMQILQFYGVIKGLNLNEARKETNTILEKLKLENIMGMLTRNLSGGQKRKVSLAIALIGGSEVLVLDEPTSGMDPEIRREIWEILLSFRGTKTILLTTHFMEEADVLCDRIAIMDCGKIKCFGSPMFLKSKYGKGYILSIVLNEAGQSNEITDEIKRYIPSAKLKSQNIRTVSFELLESEVNKFPALLTSLDVKQGHSEIVSYGISVASLEDVFLKMRNQSQDDNDVDQNDSINYVKILNSQNKKFIKWTGYKLYFNQFLGLQIKKWILLKRRWKIFLLYSVLAAGLMIFTSLFSGTLKTQKDIDLSSSAPVTYSTDLYAPFLVLFSNPYNRSDVKTFPDYIKSLNCDVREVADIKNEIYKTFKKDFHEYSTYLNLGVEFTPNVTKVYHNDRAIHMVPVGLNLVHNFFLKMNNLTNSIVSSISIKNIRQNRVINPILSGKCILSDIPDFVGSQTFFYFLEPLKETLQGAKEIQLMITPTILYWLGHLFFDIITFSIFMTVVGLWVGYSQDDGSLMENADQLIFSLLLWGMGMILIGYVISSFFKTEAGAFSTNMFIYIIFTFVLNNLISILSLSKFFLFFHPTSILKHGFSNMCKGETNYTVLYLSLYNLVLLGFLVINDTKLLSRINHFLINKIITVDYVTQVEEDELVEKEKILVDNLIKKKKTSGFALIVSDLKRWYFKGFKPLPTVKGLSFTVKEGECFGLLGVNGAGKTSTFKMLTGNIPCSNGVTYLKSEILSVFNRQKYLFQIGYCPQSGGLISLLKGRELLNFFARLRGIKNEYLEEEVEKFLEKLDLLKFADQQCGTYSGGNQRKLSTAIALIGDCNLILLDEPTSGVDPCSRRLMWNVIDDLQKQGRSVILTSHCMDECEALCSRLAIMVSGRLRCLGEITTLKKRFGQGYSVQLKVSCGTSYKSVKALKDAVTDIFESDFKLIDEHLTILHYHVTNQSISWANLFTKLKTIKDNFEFIESYTASETTLEQIFIYLARNQ